MILATRIEGSSERIMEEGIVMKGEGNWRTREERKGCREEKGCASRVQQQRQQPTTTKKKKMIVRFGEGCGAVGWSGGVPHTEGLSPHP